MKVWVRTDIGDQLFAAETAETGNWHPMNVLGVTCLGQRTMCEPNSAAPMPRKVKDRLVDSYGLTRSEARVALAFFEFVSIPQIAEHLGITVGTVRWALKNIFAKTQTRNQAELMKLLATGPFKMAPCRCDIASR